MLQKYCRAHRTSRRCYSLVTRAQALIQLYFVSFPEDGARKLGVVAAAWEKPPSPAREETPFPLKSCPIVMKVAHRAEKRCCGVPVGAPQLLEGDWFSFFLPPDPLYHVRGRMRCWFAGRDGDTRVLLAVNAANFF